jgi:hypothetical protein
MPSANWLGATDRAPIRSALRVLPSAVSGPGHTGSSQNPLRGSSPQNDMSSTHHKSHTAGRRAVVANFLKRNLLAVITGA